jgi:hypothetical protein
MAAAKPAAVTAWRAAHDEEPVKKRLSCALHTERFAYGLTDSVLNRLQSAVPAVESEISERYEPRLDGPRRLQMAGCK